MPRRLNSAVFRYSRRWAHNKGTPLGPLLFCLPLQPILMRCSSPVTLGYLEDLTLGGEESTVTADVELIKRESESLGLHLKFLTTVNARSSLEVTHRPNSTTYRILGQFIRKQLLYLVHRFLTQKHWSKPVIELSKWRWGVEFFVGRG